jgi:hypothetical protein
LNYSHYIFKKDQEILFIDKQNNNVYYNKIQHYIESKYNERLNRMYAKKEIPIFLICDNRDGCGTFTNEQINILANSKYKIMFFSYFDYSYLSNDKFVFVKHDGNDLSNIIDNYKTKILNFILA